jgi:pyruvate ferredoxin oxidoreductase gamma subunit
LIEIRYHGRGGQGAVTSAELVAIAAIEEGKFAQAMPAFGAERRGAPVLAFNRVDTSKIRLRTNVYNPDHIIVLDASLFGAVDVTSGLNPEGYIIANTRMNAKELRDKFGFTNPIAHVDASQIARDVIGIPITNTTMIGAFLKVTDLVELSSIRDAIIVRFGEKLGARNFASLEKAYHETILEG